MCSIDKVHYLVVKITKDGGFTVLAHAETEIAAHYALMDHVSDIGDTLAVCRVMSHYHVSQEMLDDVQHWRSQSDESHVYSGFVPHNVRNN